VRLYRLSVSAAERQEWPGRSTSSAAAIFRKTRRSMSGNDFYANEKSHEVSAGKLHIDVLGQPYSVQLEYAELLDLIGCFATPIPIHLAMPTRATSFRRLLRDAYAELLETIELANVPLFRIVEVFLQVVHAGVQLQSVVLFSSIARLIGVAQANYAAANQILNSLASCRKAHGCNGASVVSFWIAHWEVMLRRGKQAPALLQGLAPRSAASGLRKAERAVSAALGLARSASAHQVVQKQKLVSLKAVREMVTDVASLKSLDSMIVHTHGGYEIGLCQTTRVVFDPKPEHDVFFVIATPGWITGQSYMLIAAALLCRVPSVLLEGSPVSPADRFAAAIEMHHVSVLMAGSTFLMVAPVIMITVIEVATHYLDQQTEKQPHIFHIVQRSKELMLLGIISFGLFPVESNFNLPEFTHERHVIHILIFYISLACIVEVCTSSQAFMGEKVISCVRKDEHLQQWFAQLAEQVATLDSSESNDSILHLPCISRVFPCISLASCISADGDVGFERFERFRSQDAPSDRGTHRSRAVPSD